MRYKFKPKSISKESLPAYSPSNIVTPLLKPK